MATVVLRQAGSVLLYGCRVDGILSLEVGGRVVTISGSRDGSRRTCENETLDKEGNVVMNPDFFRTSLQNQIRYSKNKQSVDRRTN
jgi:hypothetical protein